jgi:uncharacterized protein YPO0396
MTTPWNQGKTIMPEPSLRRTVHLGQFRMTRLQVVNWGTFCGYKDFPIDERGVLFTGPSGSGKSTLMDAHSAALLPSYDQQFNASADMTARGARQGTRTITDYVRGAWSETDDEHEQSKVQYLRGGKPTWSAIGVTYDDGLGTVITGVVIRWFTGTETDSGSLKSLHHVYEGAFDLSALNEWASRGFDTRWLRAAHPPVNAEGPTAYMRELAKRIGLGTSRTALSLLGKAKAMKNVGDLNLFIRDNMLDEPATFAAAQKMLAAFTPLNEAYETAYRAHRQDQVLRDVPGSWTIYEEAGQARLLTETVMGTPAEHYLREIHLRVLGEEIDRIDAEVTTLNATRGEREEEEGRLFGEYESLLGQLSVEGQPLQALRLQLESAKAEVLTRATAYQAYGGEVTRVGLAVPADEEGFAALRAALPAILQDANAAKAEISPLRESAFGAAEQARLVHEAKAAELIALQSAKTLIPPRAAMRRELIAQGAGVPAGELPYAAELIDIAPGEERWRPAAEKVLHSFGMRLLVPERHREAVIGYIDTNDMRRLVEYSIVTLASAHQPRSSPHVLAGKLTVDTGHPCGTWLAAQLARRYDHSCVETAGDLEQHRIAVTVRGTVKVPGGYYRKDDRPELTSPSSYILGSDPAEKRAAVEAEATRLASARKEALDKARKLDARHGDLEAVIGAAGNVDGYTSWTRLDHWSAAGARDRLAERIEEAMAANVNLQRLESLCAEAKGQWKKAAEATAAVGSTISGLNQRRAALAETQQQEQRKPHTTSDDAQRAFLDTVYASTGMAPSPETMSMFSPAFRRELERRKAATENERKLAHQKMKNAIDRFLEEWPDSAPDTSGDVDRCGADFAALHQEIAQRRLPEAMTRFQQMISEDMVPSIGVLQRSIEKASTEIQARIDMVNKGLRRVAFNAGTHLQIAYKANPSEDARDFRKRVDLLLSNAPAARREAKASLAQFQRVRDLMGRFTSEDLLSRRWRASVLDVRSSFTFYGREEDATGTTVHTYRNTASNSGGEQEKLVAFCLSAALSYNLADEPDGRPRFAPLMLDEAFSKSDETFSAQALAAFDEFGFQLLIAAPIRLSGIVEPYIGQAILVEKRLTTDGAHSNAASATFGELAARRVNESDGDLRATA